MDAVLKMENVIKNFKQTQVLKGLDLEVPAGSVVGLMGKNGAGKTTLIKCALGLLKPQAGRITVFGEDVWDLSGGVKVKLGYVAQQSSFLHGMRVGDMINYTASFYPQWNTKLVEQLMGDFGLDPKANANKLSEGQKQRLSIILALGSEPHFLVLDEPAASLDPVGRRKFLKTILDTVADRECTVLFSSHITSDIERIADRVVILNEGKALFSGETDSLKENVKLLKVVFLGTRPPQLDFPGVLRIKDVGDQAFIYVKDYQIELKKKLEQQWNANIETGDLNLEEIFVEMTQ